jgi:hypothetical protein
LAELASVGNRAKNPKFVSYFPEFFTDWLPLLYSMSIFPLRLNQFDLGACFLFKKTLRQSPIKRQKLASTFGVD